MAFRQPKKQPQFADLIGILSQSKQTDNALYQTVQELINRLIQLQNVTGEEIDSIFAKDDAAKRFASKFATFLTKENDITILPNSFQLLPGLGIAFDISIPHRLTINSLAASIQTFLTQNDETATLPNSRRLVAGTNIVLDTSVASQLIINSAGGAGGSLPTDILGKVLISQGAGVTPIFSPDPSVTTIRLGTNPALSGLLD